ncbi:septum formation initiator family protein [Cellulomonas sp. Marseille-Q8402]
MPAPRRPAAPRSGAPDDDRARTPAPRTPAPRTSAVPRSPSPSPGTVGAPATPRTGVPATPRTGAPQQSVPRPATPRPAGSRARSGPAAAPRPSATRPSSSRPGGSRSSGDRRPGRAETVQQRLPRLFTVRALVMFVVLSIAFVLVFPTLRQYLDQQVQLEQLRAEVARAEQDNEDLQAELDRWSDPAYVEAQARERLAFVMPGERALRVADPEVVPEQPADDAATTPTPVEPDDPTRPWYAQIWDSVQVAGVAGTGSEGTSTGTGAAGDNGVVPDDGTDGSGPAGTEPGPEPSTAP